MLKYRGDTQHQARNEATRLTISNHPAAELNERRKIFGAMLVDKVKLLASVRVDGRRFVLGFSDLELSMTLPLIRQANRK